jgi:hypothetical protein
VRITKGRSDMSKIKKVTVGGLKRMLNGFIKQGQITNKTEIWLSSDEEGNSYSPLILVDGGINAGVEKDGSKFTLYPSSSHTTF